MLMSRWQQPTRARCISFNLTHVLALLVLTTCKTHKLRPLTTKHPAIHITYLVPMAFEFETTIFKYLIPLQTVTTNHHCNSNVPIQWQESSRRWWPWRSLKQRQGTWYTSDVYRINLPSFLLLAYLHSVFIKWIASMCFLWMFNLYCKQTPYFLLND